MDFEDSPEEAAFRAEVRSWLDANAKPRSRNARDLIRGDGERRGPTRWRQAKAWQKNKAEAGYARITWPKGMGGIGGTPMQSYHLRPGRSEIRRRQRAVRSRSALACASRH